MHDLRHTFASWLALAGVPIQVIKELLGHHNIQITMIYAHLNTEALRAASEKVAQVFLPILEKSLKGGKP